MEELPTYKITIDEQYNDGQEPLGIDMIAFTSNPAVLVKGVAFKSQNKLSFSDNLKYRITAPAMIPMEIYRRDEEMGEYYVQFTEEEIDTIHKEFMSDLKNRDIFNLEHNAEQKVPAYLLEAWIVDNPKEDKSYSTFGIDVPKGTLMVTAQITDEGYYQELVKEGRVGFSIEGFLGLKLSNHLNKYNMQLPDGEHLIEDKIYVVKDGQVVEVKEQEVELTEEVVEVEAKETTEEVKEEEVAMAEETPVTEMAVDPVADADAILAVVMPLIEEKIAEVLQVIADLKNELTESEEDSPEEEVEMKLSANQKFSNIVNFLKKNG